MEERKRPTDIPRQRGAARPSARPVNRTGRVEEHVGQTEERDETIELKEEQLTAHKHVRDAGEVRVRKVVEEVPGEIDVQAFHEEVDVDHVPIGEVVSERKQPWQDGDYLVVPVYEEQLVVTKRLVLREELRIRRKRVGETRHFQDTLRRERVVVEGPGTDVVHERHVREGAGPHPTTETRHHREDGGLLKSLVRKISE